MFFFLLFKNVAVKSGMVIYTCISSTWETEKEDHEFKASLSYIETSRPTWDIEQDPISKAKQIRCPPIPSIYL
jgi:hypothetical protein